MHSKLREREVDAFFIKCCINRLIDAKINFPIIRTFHPYTDNNIHTAVCQRMQGNERSRISQNTRVTGNNRFDHRLYFIIILTIIDTECPIYSAGSLPAKVRNRTTAERTVRDIHHFIIRCCQDRMKIWISFTVPPVPCASI